MNLDTLGAIASGITRGMRSAEERKRLEEDREFLAAQRKYMTSQMEREQRLQSSRDARNAAMAADRQALEALQMQDAAGGSKMYVVPGPGGTHLNFDDPVKAQAFVEDVNRRASGVTEAVPARLPMPSMPQQRGLPPGAQTMPLPMRKPVTTVPIPPAQATPDTPSPLGAQAPAAKAPGVAPADFDSTTPLVAAATAEAKPLQGYKPPIDASGKLDIREVVRPKRNGDALFYYGPWRSKYYHEVLRDEGPERATALDAHFKAAAELGYKQRLLEAAELQQAGDLHGVALKLNEIYNRDYVDGNFSNVRFLGDGQIEVVRFRPDGSIVDRHVQKMPDMLAMARAALTPEERAKLLVGADKGSDWKPVNYGNNEAGFYNVVTGEQRKLGPGSTHPSALPAIIGATAGLNRQQAQQAFTATQAELDRQDRARQRQELTAAEKLKVRQQDAEINNARRAWQARLAERRKMKGVPEIPVISDPDYKLYEMANRPLSYESVPGR